VAVRALMSMLEGCAWRRVAAQTRLKACKSLKIKGDVVALTGIEPVFEP
jgi:hypothetical protein